MHKLINEFAFIATMHKNIFSKILFEKTECMYLYVACIA